MSEKQQQSETCMVIKSKSQGSVATWFRSGGIFYQYFVKISRYLVKLSVSKLIASGTMCSGHCFAERWRTRLRSIAWRAVPAYHITIAALSNLDSMIDKYQTCVFWPLWCANWYHHWVSERWSCSQAFCHDVFIFDCCSCVQLVILLELWPFLSINISPGSVVTRLRGGGIFYYHFTAKLSVKEFWKLVSIWQNYKQKYSGTFISGCDVYNLAHQTGVQPLISRSLGSS